MELFVYRIFGDRLVALSDFGTIYPEWNRVDEADVVEWDRLPSLDVLEERLCRTSQLIVRVFYGRLYGDTTDLPIIYYGVSTKVLDRPCYAKCISATSPSNGLSFEWILELSSRLCIRQDVDEIHQEAQEESRRIHHPCVEELMIPHVEELMKQNTTAFLLHVHDSLIEAVDRYYGSMGNERALLRLTNMRLDTEDIMMD